jgi:hypothetical protein
MRHIFYDSSWIKVKTKDSSGGLESVRLVIKEQDEFGERVWVANCLAPDEAITIGEALIAAGKFMEKK